MTSLTDVYEGRARSAPRRARLYAGTSLVLAGAILAALAVLVGSTDPFGAYAPGEHGSVEWAGALAGLAVPIVLRGVFTALPASPRFRAAAVIGASLCLLGVALFWHAYPDHWHGKGDDLTLLVSAVYLLGLSTAIWCLLAAVLGLETRNGPDGTLETTVTRRERTGVVEAEPSPAGGTSGVGFVDGTADGTAEPQIDRRDRAASTSSHPSSHWSSSIDRSSRSLGTTSISGTPTSDGGAVASEITPLLDAGDGRDAEIIDPPEEPAEPAEPPQPTDRYCGSCAHFEYVHSDSEIVPYCGLRGEEMEDMDVCEEWTPN